MKRMEALTVLILVLFGVITGVPALADSVLYSNVGPSSGDKTGWAVSDGFAVTDSFKLIGDSQISSATFDLWVNSSNSVTSFDWAITSTPLSSALASGNSTNFSSTPVTSALAASEHQQIEQITINIPALSLSAGTYWLQLENVATALPGGAYWDESDGISQDEQKWLSSGFPGMSLPGSETFQIEGTVNSSSGSPSAVPEPSTYFLFGSGLTGLACLIRRKCKA